MREAIAFYQEHAKNLRDAMEGDTADQLYELYHNQVPSNLEQLATAAEQFNQANLQAAAGIQKTKILFVAMLVMAAIMIADLAVSIFSRTTSDYNRTTYRTGAPTRTTDFSGLSGYDAGGFGTGQGGGGAGYGGAGGGTGRGYDFAGPPDYDANSYRYNMTDDAPADDQDYYGYDATDTYPR